MTVFQRTLAASVSVPGIGYWSDRDITVTFQPAPPNSGVIFVRNDLPGKPRIPASPEFRIAIPRRTSLERNGARVEMVEHILSALAGMQVDNCEIHVDAVEMPGLDGSARAFVEAFDAVGYETQNVPARILTLPVPLTLADFAASTDSSGTSVSGSVSGSVSDSVSDSGVTSDSSGNPVSAAGISSCSAVAAAFSARVPFERRVFAVPAEELITRFEIRYGDSSSIGNQQAEFSLSPDVYRREIAPCRTFVTQQEAEVFLNAGLAKRVTFQDLLVFGPNGPVGNTLRFPNECARHKTLDLLGDLALLGARLHARVEAFCSGHDLNAEFVRKILKLYKNFKG